MPRAVVVGAVVLLLAGCIAPPAGPVGRADPARAGASPQEIFARDLRFIYEEIRDNYVNLAYKEETLGFDWDELYASYSAQLAQARTERLFPTGELVRVRTAGRARDVMALPGQPRGGKASL